jgi:hypothetical protein
MVTTILAVIRISVEGGARSKIGEARFWERGLTRSPPEFSKFWKRFSRQNFQKKKKNGGRGPTGPPTLGGRRSMTVTNNQPIGSRSGRGYVWVEARGWESAWGDTVPLFGATTQVMKKIIFKIHRCVWTAADRQRLTQQPTKNRRPQRRGV